MAKMRSCSSSTAILACIALEFPSAVPMISMACSGHHPYVCCHTPLAEVVLLLGTEALGTATPGEESFSKLRFVAGADLVKLWGLGHLTSLNLAGAANLAQRAVRSIASLPRLKALDLSCCPLLSHSMLVDLSRWEWQQAPVRQRWEAPPTYLHTFPSMLSTCTYLVLPPPCQCKALPLSLQPPSPHLPAPQHPPPPPPLPLFPPPKGLALALSLSACFSPFLNALPQPAPPTPHKHKFLSHPCPVHQYVQHVPLHAPPFALPGPFCLARLPIMHIHMMHQVAMHRQKHTLGARLHWQGWSQHHSSSMLRLRPLALSLTAGCRLT